MIDIIQGLQQRNPTLGPYVLVLRSDSRARHPSDPARLCTEAEAWIAEKAPGARLSQETVLIAPYPGAMPTERSVLGDGLQGCDAIGRLCHRLDGRAGTGRRAGPRGRMSLAGTVKQPATS